MFLALIYLISASLARADPSTFEPWITDTQRLTGESESVRQTALVHLRSTPDIESRLRRALDGADRFFALDAIAALNLKTLLPELVDRSNEDESGFFYLAINSLVDRSNQAELAKLYRQRLLSRRCPPAARVVLLDTLIRMQVKLDLAELAPFLLDPNTPEVSDAAVYYLRSFLVKYGDADFIPLLKKLLVAPDLSEGLRLRAVYAVSELPPELWTTLWRSLRGERALCPHAVPKELNAICHRLGRGNTP